MASKELQNVEISDATVYLPVEEMGSTDEEIALEELKSEGYPSDQEPEIIRKITKKCLANQRSLIDGEINSDIKRRSPLDGIFCEFRTASEIWEEGINSLLEDLMFEFGEFLPKIYEISKPNTDEVENAFSNESAHLFLVIFVGLVNVRNLKIESEKWKTMEGIVINTLTNAAITVFKECMKRIRIDLSLIVELERDLNHSIWYCKRVWSKRSYNKFEEKADYQEQMETVATLLVDNLLAALLDDQVPDRNSFIEAMSSNEPEDQFEAAWKVVDGTNFLKTCSQNWEGDNDAIRISTSLQYIITRTISRSRSREMGDLDIQSTINELILLLQNLLKLEKSTGKVIDRVLILRNIARCLKSMIRPIGRNGLYEEILSKEEVYNIQMTAWLQNLKDKEGLERFLMEMYRKGCLPSIRLALNWNSIDVLLFDLERDAIKALIEDESDFLAHLDRVSCSKYVLEFKLIFRRHLKLRKSAFSDYAIAIKEPNFVDIKATKLQLFCIALYPFLYLLDVVTDFFVATRYLVNSNYFYFFLTVTFICLPFFSDYIILYLRKIAEGDKESNSIPSLKEGFMLLPRSCKSILYAVKSRLHYHKDLETFFSELSYLRYQKKYKGAERPKRINSPNLIQALCYSRMIDNELYLFHWKMLECLNESAPQLLLQLCIVYQDLLLHKHIPIINLLGIITSLASLSWTLHLSHYNMHYEDLENNFGVTQRIGDFLWHFMIICSRILALTLVASMHHILFFFVAFIYPLVLFIVRQFWHWWHRSRFRDLEGWVDGWMLYSPLRRVFIPYSNYSLRIKIDSVLFHLETIVMAITWSLISPPLQWNCLRWILPTVIISIELLCLPALGCVNKRFHHLASNCDWGN